MLLQYAGLDDRVNATADAWQAALKAAGVDFAAFTYPNVNHAFNNDTSGARYNKEAAELAWGRTVNWLAL
jgi:carboxymethylenebutenolidase